MSVHETEIRSSEGRVGPTDDRPLTAQELRLLQRLLSDPFSFPIAYKTWLVSYLETSDLSLPISAVQGLSTLLGITGAGTGTIGLLPAGVILPYGAATAPAGTLLCDGTVYPVTAQPRLYDAIGTTYGSSGAGTFKVPDLQARFPVGKGVHADVDTLGKDDGVALPSRRPRHKHTHTLTLPTHVHTGDAGVEFVMYTTAGPIRGGADGTDATRRSTTGAPTNLPAIPGGVGPQTGAEPQDTVPFVVVNFIIIA